MHAQYFHFKSPPTHAQIFITNLAIWFSITSNLQSPVNKSVAMERNVWTGHDVPPHLVILDVEAPYDVVVRVWVLRHQSYLEGVVSTNQIHGQRWMHTITSKCP